MKRVPLDLSFTRESQRASHPPSSLKFLQPSLYQVVSLEGE